MQLLISSWTQLWCLIAWPQGVICGFANSGIAWYCVHFLLQSPNSHRSILLLQLPVLAFSLSSLLEHVTGYRWNLPGHHHYCVCILRGYGFCDLLTVLVDVILLYCGRLALYVHSCGTNGICCGMFDVCILCTQWCWYVVPLLNLLHFNHQVLLLVSHQTLFFER